MSHSLNSDYLGQLLIQVDTARLDARLVAPATQGAAVPDEARALLVFKRGCVLCSPGFRIRYALGAFALPWHVLHLRASTQMGPGTPCMPST